MQELQRLRLTDDSHDTDLIDENRALKATLGERTENLLAQTKEVTRLREKLDERTESLLVQNKEVTRLQAELLVLTKENSRLILLSKLDSDETKRKVYLFNLS